MYLTRLLLAIWLFALAGTAAELLLLGHFDGFLQLIPVGLVALGLAVGSWYAARPGPASLLAFRGTLVALALGGLAGLWLHYRGNVEFELEMYPGLSGTHLVWQAVTGATPTLAPGAMVVLALIGYSVTLARSRDSA